MKLEIKFVQVDGATILLYDKTMIGMNGFPSEIFSITMDITSANIPGGSVTDIDIVAYMREYRTDFEMYKITNTILGLKEGDNIPDGTYYFTIRVNNVVNTEYTIAVVTEVKQAIEELSTQVYVTAEITETDLFINSTVSNSVIMKWLYAISLYYKLIQDTTKVNNSSAFNDDLDKLRRVLVIVKTLING